MGTGIPISQVDYDEVAASYERRYETTTYPGILRLLHAHAAGCHTALEVGCGTGHWLRVLNELGLQTVGLDLKLFGLVATRSPWRS